MSAFCHRYGFCGILREQGAEAGEWHRCGFGAYFIPGRIPEDHWVAEYWGNSATQNRWILVDAQLDAVQRKTFKPSFDPLDVPRDGFILAGDVATVPQRSGRSQPLRPLRHQRAGVVVGLPKTSSAIWPLSNRMEMLPWDV